MPYLLHCWESHPEFPEAEVRLDSRNEVVLSLSPEGCEGSQCWAWDVRPARRLPLKHGVNIGSDTDKETARKQADLAAVTYGYTLEQATSWAATARRDAPAVALRVVGMPLSQAVVISQEVGITLRVNSVDGRVRPTTDDIRRDRVTVSVMGGMVTAAYLG